MPQFDLLLDIHEDIFKAAEMNDEETVKFFVEEENVLANTTDTHGRTPTHVAAMYGCLNIVKYLLDKDPSVLALDDQYGDTILVKAIMYGHLEVVKYLIENHNCNISEPSSQRHNGNTAIHFAAKHCHLDIVKYLIEERNGNVNVENDFKETPVFSAAEAKFKHMPIVEYLCAEKNADLKKVDVFGKNILYKAVENDDLKMMKYVLDERKTDLDLDGGDNQGNTLTHRAVSLNRITILDYLMTVKKIEVNIPNELGETPLHVAAHRNNLQMSINLIERGNASATVKDGKGRYPIERATHKRVVEYLEKFSPEGVEKNEGDGFAPEKATHERVVEYLEKRISQERRRRSVPQSGKQLPSIIENRACKSLAPSFIDRLGYNLQVDTFQNILVVARMVVKERNPPNYSSYSSSFDPMAVEAIYDISRFSMN